MLSMIVLRSTGLNQVRMSVQCIPKSFQMSSSSKNSMIGLSPLEKSYSSLFLQPSFSSFVLPPLPLPCVSLRPHKISTNPLVSPPDSRCYSKKKKGKSDSDEETNDYPAFAFDPNQLGRDMDKFVSAFADSLCKLRSSRATPALLENITFTFNEQKLVLKDICQISILDPRCLSIFFYDPIHRDPAAEAIRNSLEGSSPSHLQSNGLKVAMPKMSKEIRESIIKNVDKLAEQTKENIRRSRRDSIDKVKKAKSISKDETARMEKQIQTVTDAKILEVTKKQLQKTKEINEN